MRIFLAIFLLFFTVCAHSLVRFNPQTRLWEGNICASPWAWTYVPFQPVGTLCVIRMPNGQLIQGQIINQ